jgi:restriction system protein
MSKKVKKTEFVKWMGPLLDALRDLGDSGKPKEVSQRIAEKLNLSNAVLDETLKSGANRFHNQVQWARQYLVWEGFLDSSKHGTWRLTEIGKHTHLSEDDGHKIFLKWVAIFQADRKKSNIEDEQQELPIDSVELDSYSNLLDVLQKLSPAGFEKVCKELLREHDFENVEVTGKSHDGGIDGYGTLEINPFVSFKVIFQCKRYKGSVSRAQVGDFRNAMLGRAEKGIIMTTGTFTQDAIREANRDGAPRIELIDGFKLVEMFEKVGLGLKPKTVYEIDLNYFKSFMD